MFILQKFQLRTHKKRKNMLVLNGFENSAVILAQFLMKHREKMYRHIVITVQMSMH